MNEKLGKINYMTGEVALRILERQGWIPSGITEGDLTQFKFTGKRPAELKDWCCWFKISKIISVESFGNSLIAELYPFYKVSGEMQERQRIGKTLQDILDYAKIEIIEPDKNPGGAR